MPKISVVLPTWNRAKELCRAIQSIKNQKPAAIKCSTEIIVVDDGSSDDTAQEVSSRFPDVTLLSQTNQGVSSARNQGIRHADSDWIALLDSDDEWLPDKLNLQLAALQSQPQARLVHCDEIWIRRGLRVNAKNKHQKSGGWIYPQCLPLCVISPSAAMIRRDVFDTVGLFDESLPACEDYDYWLRFCAHEPVVYIDTPLLKKYGGHADQLSTRHWGMDRFRMQALAKAIKRGNLSAEYLALTQTQLQKKLDIFSKGATKHGNQAMAEELELRYRPLLLPDAGHKHRT